MSEKVNKGSDGGGPRREAPCDSCQRQPIVLAAKRDQAGQEDALGLREVAGNFDWKSITYKYSRPTRTAHVGR